MELWRAGEVTCVAERRRGMRRAASKAPRTYTPALPSSKSHFPLLEGGGLVSRGGIAQWIGSCPVWKWRRRDVASPRHSLRASCLTWQVDGALAIQGVARSGSLSHSVVFGKFSLRRVAQ